MCALANRSLFPSECVCVGKPILNIVRFEIPGTTPISRLRAFVAIFAQVVEQMFEVARDLKPGPEFGKYHVLVHEPVPHIVQ